MVKPSEIKRFRSKETAGEPERLKTNATAIRRLQQTLCIKGAKDGTKGVNKVVSFGIGALESARASAETLLKNLETEINALIANGESVQSENAVKVRSAATDASKRVSTILDQAKAQYTDLSAKAQKAYADLSAKASELAAKLPINKGQAA